MPNKISNNMYNDKLKFLVACHMYRINNSIVAWQSGNIVQMCFQAFEYIKSMADRLDSLFLLNTEIHHTNSHDYPGRPICMYIYYKVLFWKISFIRISKKMFIFIETKLPESFHNAYEYSFIPVSFFWIIFSNPTTFYILL